MVLQKLPKSATSQIEKKQREYNDACIERGERLTETATFLNTTLKTIHLINRAVIVDLVVYDKDSNFTQTLINDLVKVTRNKALTITSLLKTIVDGSFGENIGKKLLDDHEYSQEEIKELKTLLISLNTSTDPELQERLSQYSTGNYENYIFGMKCDKCTAVKKANNVQYKDMTDEQKATHTASTNAAAKIRKVVQAEALQQVIPEGTGVCDRCMDPFHPYDTRIIGSDKSVCEPCNRDTIFKRVALRRVKVEEKIKQLNACQDVQEADRKCHRDGTGQHQHGDIQPRPWNNTRLNPEEKEDERILCGCALRHNCKRFALGCSNFETLIQGVLETLDESKRFGEVLNGGVEWNINLLQKAFPEKDRTLCRRMLAENIVMACFDYHHSGAYHLGGNKKIESISNLSNEEDRNFEAKKCVVKFKACHHWDHTIHKQQDYCTPIKRQRYEAIKGKEDLFVIQGSVCKGVGFDDSSHRKCLLGLDNPKTVATLRYRVQ